MVLQTPKQAALRYTPIPRPEFNGGHPEERACLREISAALCNGYDAIMTRLFDGPSRFPPVWVDKDYDVGTHRGMDKHTRPVFTIYMGGRHLHAYRKALSEMYTKDALLLEGLVITNVVRVAETDHLYVAFRGFEKDD